MNRPAKNAGTISHALRLHRMGLRLVPLWPCSKVPLVKNWPELRLDDAGIVEFDNDGVNWGVITGELVVVLDTDTAEAEAWADEHDIDSAVVVRSGREDGGRTGGLHRYFLSPEGSELHSKSGLHGIKGLDFKGWRSFIVAAGSVHPVTGRRYEYLPGKELNNLHALPVFDVRWLQERHRDQVPCRRRRFDERTGMADKIHDVRAYIRRIPSIQGANGSNAAYRVAALLYEAGLNFDEILAEMEDWNELCAIPLWSRPELIHKIASVFKRNDRQT